MSDNGLPNLPGYVSIKEAAKIMSISEKMVYFYVNKKRLPAKWAADILEILLDEIKKFRLKPIGWPHKKTPLWLLISTGDYALLKVSVQVQLQTEQQDVFKERLAEIRQLQYRAFPGMMDRCVAERETSPGLIDIQLTWRMATIPDGKAI